MECPISRNYGAELGGPGLQKRPPLHHPKSAAAHGSGLPNSLQFWETQFCPALTEVKTQGRPDSPAHMTLVVAPREVTNERAYPGLAAPLAPHAAVNIKLALCLSVFTRSPSSCLSSSSLS